MKLAASILLVLVTALVQVTIIEHIAIGGVYVDVVVLVVVAVALLSNSVLGAVHGFIGGAAIALFAGLPLGSHAFVGSIIGFVVGRWSESLVTEEHPVPPVLAAAFGVATMQVGRPLVEFLVRPGASEVGVSGGMVLAMTLVGTLVALPIYISTRAIIKRVPDLVMLDTEPRTTTSRSDHP